MGFIVSLYLTRTLSAISFKRRDWETYPLFPLEWNRTTTFILRNLFLTFVHGTFDEAPMSLSSRKFYPRPNSETCAVMCLLRLWITKKLDILQLRNNFYWRLYHRVAFLKNCLKFSAFKFKGKPSRLTPIKIKVWFWNYIREWN